MLKIPNKKVPLSQPVSGVAQSGVHVDPPPKQIDPATATILESITYAQRKFLKIKVRHVTDGNGVVSGTLLITPNAVMFDPNVSDPLVIEQGAETYGIIVPIEYIVGASIWSDICGMRVRGKVDFVAPGPRPMLWGEDKGEKSEESEDGSQESQELVQNRLEEVTDHPLKDEGGGGKDEVVVHTWYFCLTIGRPARGGDGEGAGGSGGSGQLRRSGRRNPFCVTYGQKNSVRPEFWFSVGREQVSVFEGLR